MNNFKKTQMILKFRYILFAVLLFGLTNHLNGQAPKSDDTSVVMIQEFDDIYLPRNFQGKYKIMLKKVKRVYPLALHAAEVVDSLEKELAATEKRRKQKKIARKTHKKLKEEFKFLLKSLYVSEGVVLSKLIYRETGMTVQEIIDTYKGGVQATLYTSLAGMFDQELDATYDPEKEDFIIECIVNDINSGKIDVDLEFETMSRKEYREDRAEYRKRKRENKKKYRERRKEKRKEKRKSRRNKK